MSNNKKEIQTTEARPASVVQTDRVQQVFSPLADIIETKEHYTLTVDMPGVDENSVDITLENDVLTILGRVHSTAIPNARAVYSEYEIGDYRRVFSLTDGVDRDRIEAKVKDGVLHLTLPKAEKVKAKRIEVRAG